MTIALLTNIISPHRIPLSVEMATMVGCENYRYYYTEVLHAERLNLGWNDGSCPEWCMQFNQQDGKVERVDILISGHREWDIFERRAKQGLLSIYASERWFKPRLGFLRVIVPSYLKMAFRFVRMLSQEKRVYYFPQGIHAAMDMARLCGLLHGDLRCLFRAPSLGFERKPCGRIWLKRGRDDKKYCLDKMRTWGYFVEKGAGNRKQKTGNSEQGILRVLWVGRLLNWKRVDTIIKAVGELAKRQNITLDIYGTGPEEERLKRLATKYGEAIKFYPPVPIAEVRKLMREHDVYVLASNGYEGWGAVVNEALEEGMRVIGTYEAGASATILPEGNLFNAGDWVALQQLISKSADANEGKITIGCWAPCEAAKVMLDFCAKNTEKTS